MPFVLQNVDPTPLATSHAPVIATRGRQSVKNAKKGGKTTPGSSKTGKRPVNKSGGGGGGGGGGKRPRNKKKQPDDYVSEDEEEEEEEPGDSDPTFSSDSDGETEGKKKKKENKLTPPDKNKAVRMRVCVRKHFCAFFHQTGIKRLFYVFQGQDPVPDALRKSRIRRGKEAVGFGIETPAPAPAPPAEVEERDDPLLSDNNTFDETTRSLRINESVTSQFEQNAQDILADPDDPVLAGVSNSEEAAEGNNHAQGQEQEKENEENVQDNGQDPRVIHPNDSRVGPSIINTKLKVPRTNNKYMVGS